MDDPDRELELIRERSRRIVVEVVVGIVVLVVALIFTAIAVTLWTTDFGMDELTYMFTGD